VKQDGTQLRSPSGEAANRYIGAKKKGEKINSKRGKEQGKASVNKEVKAFINYNLLTCYAGELGRGLGKDASFTGKTGSKK